METFLYFLILYLDFLTFKSTKINHYESVGFTTEGFIGYVTINDNDSCFEGMQYIFHEHIKVNPSPAKYRYQTQRVPSPEDMVLMDLNK